MIRELVSCNDPILKAKMEPFDFKNPPTDPVQLYYDLGETMIENNGIGLSANQVGLPYRAFVLKAQEVIGVFNPRIVDASTESVVLEEGCLSYPNLFVKVKRPAKIRVRYTLPNGETVTKVFEGLTARAFQHEMDHLDGITYTNRANSYHLKQAKRHAEKLKKYPSLARSKLTIEAQQALDQLYLLNKDAVL